jgi:hypothetical protein
MTNDSEAGIVPECKLRDSFCFRIRPADFLGNEMPRLIERLKDFHGEIMSASRRGWRQDDDPKLAILTLAVLSPSRDLLVRLPGVVPPALVHNSCLASSASFAKWRSN